MTIRGLLTLLSASALFTTSAAHAGQFLPHRSHLTLTQKVAYFERSIHHEHQAVAWLRSEQAPRTLERVSELGWFRAALAWHRRLLVRYRAKLDTRTARAAGHYALWSCITNGAYPGAPHEGDGYNGSYTGPLGMTTPWEGHYPTDGDWVSTPVATVYAFAEQEYQERLAQGRGYAIAWLEGQWPQTSPPCLGFA